MAYSENIILTEQEQQEIIKMYKECVTELHSTTKKMVEELHTLVTETKYKDILDKSNIMVDFYNTKLSLIIKKHFSNWVEEDGSLHKVVDLNEGGSSAVSCAKKLEKNLEAEIDGLFATKIPEIKVDTSEVNMNPERYEEFKNSVVKYSQELDNLIITYKGKIDGNYDNNLLWGTIYGPVMSTLKSTQGEFNNLTTIFGDWREEYLSRTRESKSKIENMRSQIDVAIANDTSNLVESLRSLSGLPRTR